MTRNIYNKQLNQLNDLIIEMSQINAKIVSCVVDYLEKGSCNENSFIVKVKQMESTVDEKESQIERLCLKLIIRQQPVASDLLFITAAMKMITDMERIADQAVDVSQIAIKVTNRDSEEIQEIIKTAKCVCEMVEGVLQSYVEKSQEKAKKVCKMDDIVDCEFLKIKDNLTQITAKNNNINGENALDLLMIAKYLERIGDHAVNIAEWIIFSITGNRIKI